MTNGCQLKERAELDRRHSSRTFEYKRPNLFRRRARRTYLFDEVFWHRRGDTKYLRGILVGVSGTGLALVTQHNHGARVGLQITPSKKGRNRRWRKPVMVKRVDRLSSMLDLVAAEYQDPTPASA